ncbi:MAG: DMT family transporter [Chloroflexota bacterium]|nr:DMT family transporter [Chloroflexota bacterium]
MGELAALATSLFWSVTSVQFTLAGQRVGSPVVNRVRLVLGLLFLSLAHFLIYGRLWPLDAASYRWVWLGLSGIVGLVLGDASLFQSFVLIGPRRSMLVMTLVPVISAALAWVFLGEVLSGIELFAIALTVGGVAWVVSQRTAAAGYTTFPGDRDRRIYTLGLLLALGGALGQAVGLVLAKRGLAGEFPALSATIMRMLVATIVIWLLAVLQRKAVKTLRSLKDRRALFLIAGGAFTGPFLGVWGSMIAVQAANVGIASTLMSLPPILLIPIGHLVFGEQITPRAVAGTLVALAGITLIFLT